MWTFSSASPEYATAQGQGRAALVVDGVRQGRRVRRRRVRRRVRIVAQAAAPTPALLQATRPHALARVRTCVLDLLLLLCVVLSCLPAVAAVQQLLRPVSAKSMI